MLSSLEHLALKAVSEHIASEIAAQTNPAMSIAVVAPNSLPLPEQQTKLVPLCFLLQGSKISAVVESGSCHFEPKLRVIFNEHVDTKIVFACHDLQSRA